MGWIRVVNSVFMALLITFRHYFGVKACLLSFCSGVVVGLLLPSWYSLPMLFSSPYDCQFRSFHYNVHVSGESRNADRHITTSWIDNVDWALPLLQFCLPSPTQALLVHPWRIYLTLTRIGWRMTKPWFSLRKSSLWYLHKHLYILFFFQP
jgi:hypothetical protein